MRAPTGEQFVLSRPSAGGGSRAIITELAAGLRSLSIDGVDITEPYADHSSPPFADGIVLVPWPNRVKDGIWMLEGEKQQLDLTEVDRHNAIHGLLRNTAYRVVEQSEDALTLAATVFPQHGYPFLLDTTVRYELLEDGLRVTHGIVNQGDKIAPVAIGVHPFFRIGDVSVGALTLSINATSRFETDARLNPTGEVPVDGTNFDLRGGRSVGGLELDHAFSGLTPEDGVIRHRLCAPDGRSLQLWQDAEFPYVQVFTTREFPNADGIAIAIEPMTAPPNALNSGEGLRWLRPGESWSVSWGVVYDAGTGR
ncbi:MAG: hypothetical protein JWP30_431 [Homoserinimonas sp.]|nr:hypothetical protein [Homoserinimonas sp.]